MNERDTFLRAICENPDDDTPRLVFADWLDENGDKADCARAEFIRVQIELAGLPDGKKKQNRQAREKELLDAHKEEWTEPLKPYYAYYYQGPHAHYYSPPVVFRRGFVETIAMDVESFGARGTEVFALAPIRELRIQDAQSLDDLAKSKHLLRLTKLNLAGAILSADGSDSPVLFRSKHLANLMALVARGHDDNGHLDAAGLRAIAGSRHFAKLERLDISDNWLFGGYNPIREETACRELLWKLGEKMPALRELRLSGMGLRCGDLSALTAQPWVSRLRVLDLSKNQLAEHGCRALCESKYLANLERLDVSGNEHSDDQLGTFEPLSPATKRALKKHFGKRVVL
jgi:uncharacterized protein (TIGR02996 family)